MTESPQSNEQLLQRLRRKEPSALQEAVARHGRPLYRAARGMGFASDAAEDLVQDVFTTMLERIGQFEGRSQLRTWLFGVLHNKSLERRRALAKEALHDAIDEEFAARFDGRGHWKQPPAGMERLLLSEEAGRMIRGCLEALPDAQRKAFVLREIEEVESAEICKILAVSITNYGVLMHRARLRLRECLEAKGLSRT